MPSGHYEFGTFLSQYVREETFLLRLSLEVVYLHEGVGSSPLDQKTYEVHPWVSLHKQLVPLSHC